MFYPWIVLSNVIVMTFLAIFSAAGTMVADSAIQGELALSNREAVWLTTLYLLGINTIVPSANWFADRFGYKKIYLLGVLVFSIASSLATFAVGFWTIALARLVEGMGAGFIFPVGLAKVAQNFSKEKLSFALILYVAVGFGAGLAVGLIISGYFSQLYSWRLIFALISFIGLIAALFCWFINEETTPRDHFPFDFLGYGCFITFIATLLIALTYGPLPSTDGGWRSPFILSCFAVAAICLIATIWVETHHEHPILPLSLFKDPMFTVSALAMFLLGMSFFASVSTIMQYMLQALQYERIVSSKIGTTYGIAMALSSILASALLKKIPPFSLTFLGLFLLVVSYFLNNILDLNTGPDQIFWILLLRGIGVGFSLGPTTILALQKIPKELSSKAATLLTFFRQVGGTYGGTLIAILVIKRKIFHAARFGEQTNEQLVGYRVTFNKVFGHFYSQVSDKGLESAHQAKMAIVKDIEMQAFVVAQNDALMVLGYLTTVVTFLLLAIAAVRWWKGQTSQNLSF